MYDKQLYLIHLNLGIGFRIKLYYLGIGGVDLLVLLSWECYELYFRGV
jgi:hypothetical protein